jgi:glycogen debranching enzyme
MLDVIEVENEYYVRARSSLADSQTRVLMQGDLFAVFDRHGDFQPVGFGEHGLYYREPRHLSTLVLSLPDERLGLLSSTVREDNAVLTVDLTNADLELQSGNRLPHGSIHIYRTKFLNQNICYEQIRVRNYWLGPVSLELLMRFAADFADIFEIRGHRRKRSGKLLPPEIRKQGMTFAYEGLDGVLRTTNISTTLNTAIVTESEIRSLLDLELGEKKEFVVTICCYSGTEEPILPYHQAVHVCNSRKSEIDSVEIYTSNEQFNNWVNRSRADLRMMITETSEGPYPYAGVPWFGAPFGRDRIITAIECLWFNPALARGVLKYLAATQATENDPAKDAEPGKILHETRKSELAQIGEVLFGRYYGSADSTPLILYLAAAYFERTRDRALIETIWPNIEFALSWIQDSGDSDADGFVEYQRRSGKGLVHQGWKDCQDSVFHADGSLAEAPIALCELQAYVYAAKTGYQQWQLIWVTTPWLGHCE